MTPAAAKRILIVDDRKQLATNYRDFYLSVGWVAEAVFNGLAAVRAAAAGPAFDIVLLDLRMPGFDGLKTLDALLAHDRELCVIMFTGFGDVPSAVDAMRRGAAGMIEKANVEFKDVAALVDEYHRRHLAACQAERDRRTVARLELELKVVRAELFLDLANVFSHKVKNRGVAINRVLYRLRKEVKREPQLAHLAPVLDQGEDAYDALMHDLETLNTYATIPRATPQPVRIDDAVRQALADVEKYHLHADWKAAARVRVVTELRATGLVMCLPDLLAPAVEFLVQNSLREFEREPPEPWEVRVETADAGDRVTLVVSDTGPGFGPTTLDWLRGGAAGPPHRAARSATVGVSFGIGLYSAIQVVRASGGSFEAGNRPPPDHGAVVRFTLVRPAAAPPGPPTTA